MDWTKTRTPGIYLRHRKDCASHEGGKCRCKRSWRVRYRDETGSKWSKVFRSEDEAKNWQSDRRNGRTSAIITSAGKSFNDLADEFFELAESGAVPKNSGRKYGRGTLTAYKSLYSNRVRPELGRRGAAKLTAKNWQLWVDDLSRQGLKRNSINVGLNCVRAIYRWACSPTRMILSVNATRGLQLPAFDETPRDRVATPDEAAKFLDTLRHKKCHPCDRVSYALALYAGLRNVERLPLDWSHIDFKANVIRVKTTKGEGGAGIRTLPIVAPLKAILAEEFERQGEPSTGRVCRGPKGGAPEYNSMVNRAYRAWTAAGLDGIGLHECRHTFITTMIAAGLNAKAVSALAGHASIDVTFDRYGHLFPGSEDEAGSKLNAFYGSATGNVVPIREAA